INTQLNTQKRREGKQPNMLVASLPSFSFSTIEPPPPGHDYRHDIPTPIVGQPAFEPSNRPTTPGFGGFDGSNAG
ncbi:hypothetical protein, partial [Corynebacterium sp. HMSC077D03]|uniref:hypothetical protein n=1 Tax=Corynebacterium sp. HMSC077D03 TaxID=1739392 RepID=UPI001AEFEB6B